MGLQRFEQLVGVATLLLIGSVAGAEPRASGAETSPTEATTDAQNPSAKVTPSNLIARPQGTPMEIERGVSLLLGDGAQAKPGYSGVLMVGRDGGRIKVQSVRVAAGRVDAVIPSAEVERGVLLAGPDAITAISSGGRLAFSVTDKEVHVQALDGEALAGSKGRFKQLLPGVIRVFQRATGRFEDEAPKESPHIIATTGLGVAITGGAKMSVRAPEAGTYCFALTTDEGIPIGESQCAPGQQDVTLQVPSAGIFYAVARRLYDGAMGSALSKPVKLQVLGLAEGQPLPDDGVFILERWQRLQLRGTEGLELRYGVSKIFVPASSSVGLPQGRATTIEFRHPQSPDQRAVLRLAPRYGKVTTSIGPPTARWPGKPVRVAVQARDGRGRVLREGEHLRLRLTVNGELVDADWKYAHHRLVTEIPARSGKGPWVVRLSVFDNRDKMLARDFLEVVPPK